MEHHEIIDFYDEFIADQQKSGVNDRIWRLFRRMVRLGLKSGSTVLELGSGIGTMTFLLSTHVKNGFVEAVDISPKSVDFARQKIRAANIRFVADDIVQYKPSLGEVDFITLFDVIEHIPLERHDDLFKNLAAIAGPQTKILVNIPNPAYIEYDRLHNPGALQFIDQPVPLTTILDNLVKNGLSLLAFDTHSVWVENDYQFLIITPQKVFEEVPVQKNFLQKAIRKARRTYVKIAYRY